MALADSERAIGAVTRVIQDHLLRRGFEVTVGKPEEAADTDSNAKLNLFLYELAFDAHLRNHTLAPERPEEPALWLVLKYLLTAFDQREKSDSAAAHDLLGRGLAALHAVRMLPLDAAIDLNDRLALENNPEPIKLTFEATDADLLSKIMQGTDERYRLSVAFQARPVMITPQATPRESLLVGIDYSTAPETVIAGEGIRIDVQPTLGARLDRVEPPRFAAGAGLTLHGSDLLGADLEVVLGDVVLTVTERHPDRILALAEGDAGGAPQGPIAAGGTLSAGELPLRVQRRTADGRTRGSNLLLARLLPTVGAATLLAGDLILEGLLLGGAEDDVRVSFYRESDGVTVRQFDTVESSPDQQHLTVRGVAAAVAAGTYRIILRVNNQQARTSPRVSLP